MTEYTREIVVKGMNEWEVSRMGARFLSGHSLGRLCGFRRRMSDIEEGQLGGEQGEKQYNLS